MTIWTKLGLATFLLAVLSGLALLYGNAREETGRLEERTAQQSAHAEWRRSFDKDRTAGALRVSKAEADLRDERRRSDAKIAEILRNDKDAQDWINSRMPISLGDALWLFDTGRVSVLPSGDGTVAGFDPTGASYRTSHER